MFVTLADAPHELAAWSRRAILGALAALTALGALLAARRLAGAFDAALPAPQLLAVAMIAGVASIGGRQLWRQISDPITGPVPRPIELFVGLSGAVSLLLLALGCSAGRAGEWLLWLPLLIADQASAWAFFKSARRVPSRATAPPLNVDTDDDCVLQQLVRVRDADGVEVVRGSLRADFIPGQRHATLHVGFCPPLASLPEVAAEPADGPDATVKVVQAFAHGARLEVRLAKAAAAPCHVLIDLSAAPNLVRP